MGPWPKVLLGFTAGVAIGLDSNWGNLGLKLLSLPNHPLAEAYVRLHKRQVDALAAEQAAALPTSISQILDTNLDGYFQPSGFEVSEQELPPKYQIQRLENYKKFILSSLPPPMLSEEQTEPVPTSQSYGEELLKE